MERTYYERIGRDTLRQMIEYFYDGIREDKLLRPMYPGDLEAAELRLFLFLVQYLGGKPPIPNEEGILGFGCVMPIIKLTKMLGING